MTSFQVRIAKLFFSLPESHGFLLAGGAALVAQGLSSRPTQDLDFFTSPAAGHVGAAAEAIGREARRLGWTVEVIQEYETFQRLLLAEGGPGDRGEQMVVDLAVDSRPGRPPTVSILGPTFSPEELAGRKTVALFDRAEARDFVDLYALSFRYALDDLLAWASEVDPGFELPVLAEMIRTLGRFDDADLPIDAGEAPALRSFFAAWAENLAAS